MYLPKLILLCLLLTTLTSSRLLQIGGLDLTSLIPGSSSPTDQDKQNDKDNPFEQKKNIEPAIKPPFFKQNQDPPKF